MIAQTQTLSFPPNWVQVLTKDGRKRDEYVQSLVYERQAYHFCSGESAEGMLGKVESAGSDIMSICIFRLT